MQSGSGAGIETYGFGRYPSYAEHVVIIPVIDGSFLPPNNPEVNPYCFHKIKKYLGENSKTPFVDWQRFVC